MDANYKPGAVIVTAVLLAGFLAGCAEMAAYYRENQENAKLTPAQKLSSEGQTAASYGNYAGAADKFKQIVDADLCSTGGEDPEGCLLSAKLWLAYVYEKQGLDAKALPYYREVAGAELQQPADAGNEGLVCSACVFAANILLKDNKHDDAFYYFDSANGIVARNNSACDTTGERESIVHGLANTVKGKNDAKRVIPTVKDAYYKKPTSSMHEDYGRVLSQAGDKKELKNIGGFQDEVMSKLEKWEKLHAPSDTGNESAVIKYNQDRAVVYTSALKAVEQLGLKGYDDYLIGEVRASKSAVDSVLASQRYREEAARHQQEQDARDQEMMNMFMNILNAPRY